MKSYIILLLGAMAMIMSCRNKQTEIPGTPGFRLVAADTIHFNSFVDCNMAEAWIGDTFRIFPGKYGEDPVWAPHYSQPTPGKILKTGIHRCAWEKKPGYLSST